MCVTEHGSSKLFVTVSHLSILNMYRCGPLTLNEHLPGSITGPTIKETLPVLILSTRATSSPLPPVPTTAKSPATLRQMTPCPWQTVVCKCVHLLLKPKTHRVSFTSGHVALKSAQGLGMWSKTFCLDFSWSWGTNYAVITWWPVMYFNYPPWLTAGNSINM